MTDNLPTDNLPPARLFLAKAAPLALGLLLLVGCVDVPTAERRQSAATSAAPLAATLAPVVTSPSTPVRTPRPTAIPVGDATIEITGMNTHTTISPRKFVRVLTTDSPLVVTVHFPGSVDGREVDTKITQPASVFWTIQTGGASDASTVNFGLTGTEPGIFTVQVLAEGYAPVIFGVQASLPPTPATAARESTATGTPAAVATAAPNTTAAVVGTSIPSVSGPIVGSAVPSTGSLTTATATPPPAAVGGSRTITLTDNNGTVTLHVGERFLLALGEGYDWQVTVGNPTIVSRVPNIFTVRGSQGLYEGHKPGQTTLLANGDPTCRKDQPPCMMPSRLFQVQVIVQ